MNRIMFNKNLLHTNICSKERCLSNFISKGFIKSLINNEDYEITSRNTSLS